MAKPLNSGLHWNYRVGIINDVQQCSQIDSFAIFLPAPSILSSTNSSTWLAACSLSLSTCDMILAISKLAHITAAIKVSFTVAQDSPKRNSTTEESASEFLTFFGHDLFMRGEQSNQTRKSPQVGGFMCVWKFLSFIHSQPSDYSGGAGISCVSETLVLQAMYLSVSLSSVTACWASKPFLSALPPRPRVLPSFTLHLLENLCNLNGSYSALIAQTHPEYGGWGECEPRTDKHANTWCFCSLRGCHHGGMYTRLAADQNKTRRVRWLHQTGRASHTLCTSESCLAPLFFCFKCEQASPDIQPWHTKEVFCFCFFLGRILACSH